LKKSGGAYLPKASPLKVTSNEQPYSNSPLGVKKKQLPGIMGAKPGILLAGKAPTSTL
jgi:hypothetical protein